MSISEPTPPARKRRRKKAVAQSEAIVMPAFAGGLDITLPDPEPEVVADGVTIDPKTGAVTVDNEDGSITIDPTGDVLRDLEGDDDDDTPTEHGDNLALSIDSIEMNRISEDLLMAIQSDKQDRSQWEQMRAKTIELLGLKLEDPKSDVSTSSMGMSTSVVRDPILLEAVERGRANAYAELCPAAGPVKVVDWGSETASTENLASALQKDLNYYLTTTASEYYPDTYYMLWWTYLASGTFKKVYKCPLRRRPVSEYVDGTHLIVPSNATDLKNAGRITHELTMRRAVMKRMQILGVYRSVDLSDPLTNQPNVVEMKRANVEGKAVSVQRIEDQEYTVYECYCELDIKGFEHEEDGEPTGLPLPYRVTIEEGSRQILEIRRNWDEDDEDQAAQIPFVLFPYSTGLSRIYGSGLGQMGGNIASALTALLRISIDGGMMANYPGLLKAKGSGRQLSNEIIVPPGGCAEVDTGGLPIQQAVMGMPYKDVSPAIIQLMSSMREVGQRLLGSADLQVGEGRQDVAMGTVLATIEQATKVESAVHKQLHAAQSEEFRLLVKLFRDDPEALWRGNRRPALGTDKVARLVKFKEALENCDIQPMADPNVPSDAHRILKWGALKQLAAPGGVPNPAYNQLAVDRRGASILKIDDFDSLLAPPQATQQPPVDPLAMAALQIKGKEVEIKQQLAQVAAAKAQADAQNKAADRQSKEGIASMDIAAKMHAQQKPDQGVNPLDAAALQLKQQQLGLQHAKLQVDAQNAHADRQSKETVEGLRIAERMVTHPESQPVVNSEIAGLSPFMKPVNADQSSMANGGEVSEDRHPMSHDELAELVAKITRALDRPSSHTSH